MYLSTHLAHTHPRPVPLHLENLALGGELVTSRCVYSSASVCASCQIQMISRATVVPAVYTWDNLPQGQLSLGLDDDGRA